MNLKISIRKFRIRFLLTVVLTGSFVLNSYGQIVWPEITEINKPWTRWWWEGSAVDEPQLVWNLEQYSKAGLGGVEITPIYGVYGAEKKFINFLSPRWMQLFSFTLNESKRLGLGVDLANATGWPFGGPWVTDDDASKTIYHKVYTLQSGEQLTEPVTYTQEALVRTTNNKKANTNEIRNPVSLNKNLQELALDQIQYPGKLPLICLMAYGPGETIFNLTDSVDTGGRLNWTAPGGSGAWTLYALFQGLHGKMVERAAPGGEGYAIDHFSKQATENYFRKFDEAFKGTDISYLRGFFNDSYEVDDAVGEANWTPGFFKEFLKRKKYDLREELPALFGNDTEEKNSRVIYDYRSVIDELLLEHFTLKWKKWGHSKGKILRNQSHGSPANTLDLYSAVDIPETEGDDILRFKFASSASNVTGKLLTSSESATWLNEHFLSSWGDVKKAIDLYFLGGVNHIVYHGTAYSPKDADWPGWLFYAAVHFQPTNPQWSHFDALNQYIARVQSFLQHTKPDNDVLLYYPIIDSYSHTGKTLLQHFDGMQRNFTNTPFEKIANEMVAEGYGFDFFSDRQLQNFQFKNGKIITGGNDYRSILLPGNKLISDRSFSKLMDLVAAGASLLVYEHLPEDVPGLSDLEQRRGEFRRLSAGLSFRKEGTDLKADFGKGFILISSDLATLMKAANVRQEKPEDSLVYLIRKKNESGRIYFVNNRSENKIEEWIHLADEANSAALFDAMNRIKGLARIKKEKGGISVFLQLDPHASVIIQAYDKKIKGSKFPYQTPSGSPQVLNGKWRLKFLEGGPVLPKAVVLDRLKFWTEEDGDEVKNFSGTARYTLEFKSPGKAISYLLNLGKVNATAEVKLNGQKIATLIGPSYTTVIPGNKFRTNNKLEIEVANLMANRIAFMDRNHIPWKIFYNINMPAKKAENSKNGLFDASDWKPLPSGLAGPVVLTPLTRIKH